ncbi:MAG: S8 family serine peptidase [Desulfobacterales bacterium]|nr:S8 family serine peptidase [Desulfobacterales bacterium]
MKNESRFFKKFGFILSVMLVLCFAMTHLGWAGNGKIKYVAGELLIQPRSGVSAEKMNSMIQLHGAKSVSEINQLRIHKVKVPINAFEKVKTALSKNPHFNFVEYNYIAEAAFEPNDSKYPSQWHLPKISAPEGWDLFYGSESFPIAIIDSGVDPTHPDLADKVIAGYNFLNNNTDTHDVLGHGTAVSGTAAAMTNNYEGVAGVAWKNPIMPLVVLDSSNYASYYNIARAITYAADRGVRVINISIGGSSSSSTLQNAVDYAWKKGTVIFACAHNYNTSTPYYPAACTNVVAVSATTSTDTRASFSNYGDWIDIAAPGTSILTTCRGGGYGSWNGTSFSSPIAAGLAALIISANPSLSNAQVVDMITQNADDLGTSGFDIYYGYGRVNVYASLIAAMGAIPTPTADTNGPRVLITSPEDESDISGSITVNATAEDDLGVEYLEFYIDGACFGIVNASPYNFNLNTESYSEGSHEIWAIAYDNAGNVGQSAAVTVYIYQDTQNTQADTQAPTVSITSPIDCSSVSGSVVVKVSAEDDIGIERVELYVNQNLFSASASAPFDFYWNTEGYAEGWYELSVIAYDAAGNCGQSSPTTVYVSNLKDIDAPMVSIISLKNGDSVSKPTMIEVSGSDNFGISRIELSIDGVCVAVTYESVLSYKWVVPKESTGAHEIEARAYDKAGNFDIETIIVYKNK